MRQPEDLVARVPGRTKNVKLSFKKNLLRIAQTTMVIAPSGVMSSASVKAFHKGGNCVVSQDIYQACSGCRNRYSPKATKLQISPTIIMIIPTHHNQFRRYA